MILLLLACPRPAPPEAPPIEPAVVEEEPGSGTVYSGRFIDGRYDLSVEVPDGWSAEIWPDTGALRVSLTHEETGTRVEAWAFETRLREPAPRGSCVWRFVDEGAYREVLRPRLVATCIPGDPVDSRISAYILDRGAVTWQLEIHIPPEHLSAGRRAGEAVLSTVGL